MICPKCQTHYAKPIVSWTTYGRKMTLPLLHLWACVNQSCQHQWQRELTSPIIRQVA
jgi:hypothetical protein